MFFSPEQVERARRDTNLAELIGADITLKRSGPNFKACCPFHNEKSPSFYVYVGKNTFKCWGCKVGGDAITWVMNREHLTFPEAVEKLLRRINAL